MPFINGKRVSNAEFRAWRGQDSPVTWKEATGWQDPDDEAVEAPEAEPAAPKRQGRKRSEAEEAILLATGVRVEVDADEEEEESE